MLKKLFAKKEYLLLIYLFIIGFFFFFLFTLLIPNKNNEFESLASAFRSGQLFLPGKASQWWDASYYHGHAYWPDGPFPAILLMPFSFIPLVFHQGVIQFLLDILNLMLLSAIAKKITNNTRTSLWLGFGYLFSTVYIGVGFLPWSWQFGQVITTTALLLALYEFFHRQRFWIIGIFLACAAATRIDTVFATLFFLFAIYSQKNTPKQKFHQISSLLFPLLFCGGLLMFYNYARFGNLLEFGYRYHIPWLVETRQFLRQKGTWSLTYIPTNLYYLFLKGPDGVFIKGTHYLTFPFLTPDPWGMSIFLTSPLLLWSFAAPIKERIVQWCWITSISILLFLLGYFSTGALQFGYRYALDFSPFLFILLCYAFKKRMSILSKIVIALSFMVNIVFLTTAYSLL